MMTFEVRYNHRIIMTYTDTMSPINGDKLVIDYGIYIVKHIDLFFDEGKKVTRRRIEVDWLMNSTNY